MTPFRIAALPLVSLLALAPLAALADEPTRTITVTGEGRVDAAPDMATVIIGVRHEAATAREALDLMNAGMAPVLENLTAAGIAAVDVQTGSLNLEPVQDYSQEGPPRLVGYAASTSITVKLRDIAQVGAALDAAVSDGANTLGGISFGLTDPAAALDGARADAVADAAHRAALYAQAAGVDLGRVLSISESGGYSPMPMMEARFAMGADAVPVAAGQVGVTAQVTVVYAIAD